MSESKYSDADYGKFRVRAKYGRQSEETLRRYRDYVKEEGELDKLRGKWYDASDRVNDLREKLSNINTVRQAELLLIRIKKAEKRESQISRDVDNKIKLLSIMNKGIEDSRRRDREEGFA